MRKRIRLGGFACYLGNGRLDEGEGDGEGEGEGAPPRAKSAAGRKFEERSRGGERAAVGRKRGVTCEPRSPPVRSCR